MHGATGVADIKLPRAFFEAKADRLAKALIGAILVRRVGEQVLRARIVETEAYLGPADLASHSSKGRTARTEVMFGPAGHAYVYLIYGLHQMLNIVAGRTGDAHAVLLRAAEPLDDWKVNLTGPGRLARGFGVTKLDNGRDLTGDILYLCEAVGRRSRIVRSTRIGIDYAGRWKDELLRFHEVNNPAVSKPTHGLR